MKLLVLVSIMLFVQLTAFNSTLANSKAICVCLDDDYRFLSAYKICRDFNNAKSFATSTQISIQLLSGTCLIDLRADLVDLTLVTSNVENRLKRFPVELETTDVFFPGCFTKLDETCRAHQYTASSSVDCFVLRKKVFEFKLLGKAKSNSFTWDSSCMDCPFSPNLHFIDKQARYNLYTFINQMPFNYKGQRHYVRQYIEAVMEKDEYYFSGFDFNSEMTDPVSIPTTIELTAYFDYRNKTGYSNIDVVLILGWNGTHHIYCMTHPKTCITDSCKNYCNKVSDFRPYLQQCSASVQRDFFNYTRSVKWWDGNVPPEMRTAEKPSPFLYVIATVVVLALVSVCACKFLSCSTVQITSKSLSSSGNTQTKSTVSQFSTTITEDNFKPKRSPTIPYFKRKTSPSIRTNPKESKTKNLSIWVRDRA